METNISPNGGKSVTNCIMGSNAFVPWTQHEKLIPIGSMGCMHTHQGMLTIEGWGSPSYAWIVVQRNGENNRKVRKFDRVLNQTPTLGLEHDKIMAWWALDVPSKGHWSTINLTTLTKVTRAQLLK